MYIEKTLQKFKKDKTYEYFPGNTIIHFLNNPKQINILREITTEMNNNKLFKNFCLLPVDSYHMTVCDILTYNDLFLHERFKNLNFGNLRNIEVIDKKVLEMLGEELFNLNILMQPQRIKAKRIELKPKTENDKLKIEQFRKFVAENVGFILPENYTFHISLSYQLMKLTDNEKEEMNTFLNKLNDKYLNVIGDVIVDKAFFTLFNDMSDYGMLKDGRLNLGKADVEYLEL